MNTLTVKDFNLQHTLESGQIFRFHQENGFYYVNAKHKLFKIKQEGNKLYYDGTSQKFISQFFNLDLDLHPIFKKFAPDKHLHRAVTNYNGLKLIQQDPWECLISFLCSSNANIPKIKLNLDLLSRYFGEKIFLDHIRSHTFPTCGSMTNLDKIKSSKTGYRAEFIHQANLIVTESFLEQLKTMPYDQAKVQLLKLNGVGPKVADCVLLFSLGFTQAFPVDTWITKAMKELYFSDQKQVSPQEIADFAQEKWGNHAGYAQQYLFHYWRMKGKNGV
ncbi:hypothetical protein HYY69_02140 [Candidatus Woesearchaeota archaeon]|nr:hypothetical protein [Candidatus Woesearchaeota archaeon]